jgi:hypothetical protein
VGQVVGVYGALGENATHPRFVRTVHRFGYAFRSANTEPLAKRTVRPQDARFRLVWAGGRLGLSDGEYVLGRDPDLELFVDSPDVSRHHARIRIAGETASIEDLDSKNGTYVKERRIQATAPLLDGDSIRVGSVQLTFTAVTNRGATETVR